MSLPNPSTPQGRLSWVQLVALIIISLLTVLCLFVIAFDEVNGRPLDSTIQAILAFVMGAASNIVGVHVGANTVAATNGSQGA